MALAPALVSYNYRVNMLATYLSKGCSLLFSSMALAPALVSYNYRVNMLATPNCDMRPHILHDKHMDDVSFKHVHTYTYIHTYVSTAIFLHE